MGKREVTVYTCDGCRSQSTVARDEPARGFRTIQVGASHGDSGQRLLCSVCFGAVEWVSRFQGITRPPRVYKQDGKYSLRSKS